MNNTYLFTTLGCKVNQHDSGAIGALLRQKGFAPYDRRAPAPAGGLHGLPCENAVVEDYCDDSLCNRPAPAAVCSDFSDCPATADDCSSRAPAPACGGPGVVIVNTCIVTAESERKSRQAIRRMRAKYPDALLAVVGCYPQMYAQKVSEIGGADIVAGTAGHEALADEIIRKFFAGGAQSICSSDCADAGGYATRICGGEIIGEFDKTAGARSEIGVAAAYWEPSAQPACPPNPVSTHAIRQVADPPHVCPPASGRVRAYVKIQDGCDNFCNYCVVPYVRGRARSRALREVLDETDAAISGGAREIVLVGTHISSYAANNDIDLGSLINAVFLRLRRAGGPLRLRLSSLEPTVVTPRFINQLTADRDVLCPHFHLSLQSGCASVLELMNRHYTPEHYLNAVYLLRGAFPGAGVTTDVIAGFPGETDDEFRMTLDFCRSAAFSKMHVFPYSKRPGTRAADLPNQVDPRVKRARAAALIALSDEMSLAFNSQYIGKDARILVERASNGVCEGLTGDYVRVYAKCESTVTCAPGDEAHQTNSPDSRGDETCETPPPRPRDNVAGRSAPAAACAPGSFVTARITEAAASRVTGVVI